jgi:hypothetical protein
MSNFVSTATDMTTLGQVLDQLRFKGWNNEFHYGPKGLYLEEKHFYKPESLEIIKTYRFEGDSNPSDSSILYIIQAHEGKVGYMVDAYGMYSNHEDQDAYNNFMRHVSVTDRHEQLIFDL